jgi:hypothetical protein
MKKTLVMASLVSSLLVTGCSVFGIRSGTEEPHFAVIDHVGPIEIRRYEARLAAETNVQASESEARSIGFGRLAGYIFGGNTAKQSIAMTAPVAQAQASQKIAMTAPVAQTPAADGAWTIRFFLPAGLTEASAPTPNDSRVHVVVVPPETVAVLRYTGWYSAADVAAAEGKLMKGLQGTRWTPDGAPFSWFYDPPWTLPFLRRNEAVVAVSPPP